uniref:Zn(2)-C6 fungal-type domain-containing protein n=1 Tax=Calcidiscus leptoporus TaxID=127549 RepID=A0A7S0IRZ0_9EUKA|mmetsp:Transcript_19688/g.45282  ORF Transcript_19688/g.45282 Transcript_19688/m.45282 type:complete len:489 (+) Transcript_19688:1-1467(+)
MQAAAAAAAAREAATGKGGEHSDAAAAGFLNDDDDDAHAQGHANGAGMHAPPAEPNAQHVQHAQHYASAVADASLAAGAAGGASERPTFSPPTSSPRPPVAAVQAMAVEAMSMPGMPPPLPEYIRDVRSLPPQVPVVMGEQLSMPQMLPLMEGRPLLVGGVPLLVRGQARPTLLGAPVVAHSAPHVEPLLQAGVRAEGGATGDEPEIKRRATSACAACHERKLRCVMQPNGTCTQCQAKNRTCVSRIEKKRGRPKNSTRRNVLPGNANVYPAGNAMQAMPMHAQSFSMHPPRGLHYAAQGPFDVINACPEQVPSLQWRALPPGYSGLTGSQVLPVQSAMPLGATLQHIPNREGGVCMCDHFGSAAQVPLWASGPSMMGPPAAGPGGLMAAHAMAAPPVSQNVLMATNIGHGWGIPVMHPANPHGAPPHAPPPHVAAQPPMAHAQPPMAAPMSVAAASALGSGAPADEMSAAMAAQQAGATGERYAMYC